MAIMQHCNALETPLRHKKSVGEGGCGRRFQSFGAAVTFVIMSVSPLLNLNLPSLASQTTLTSSLTKAKIVN